MNNSEIVYQAIKTHNTTNPRSPNQLVPAHIGDIKNITGLQQEEIESALEILIRQGRIIHNDPVLSTGIDNYGAIISYGKLFAI